ncbi:hypothetical protein BDZ45DRAFT_740818 [Acephala macrosclerotiorum]|nr:hypothetical protein BDZ45DRAFT_740818 [Acephala macrosclerotiorum]
MGHSSSFWRSHNAIHIFSASAPRLASALSLSTPSPSLSIAKSSSEISSSQTAFQYATTLYVKKLLSSGPCQCATAGGVQTRSPTLSSPAPFFFRNPPCSSERFDNMTWEWECKKARPPVRQVMFPIETVPTMLPDSKSHELYGFAEIAGKSVGSANASLPPTRNDQQHTGYFPRESNMLLVSAIKMRVDKIIACNDY